jgi:CDP-diacylglycerol--glycerol-3-phosphate 3-phosphatidyltransferase
MAMPLDRHTALLSLRRQTIVSAALWAVFLALAAVLLAGRWGAAASLRWFLQASLVSGAVLVGLARVITLNHRTDDGLLRPGLGAANGITLLRAGGIALLAGFLFHRPAAAAAAVWLAWAPGVLYLAVCMLDALDGYLARVTASETRLGERLDVEIDALGLLVASALLVWSGKAPAFFLAVGLGVYGLRAAAALRRRRGNPVHAVPPRATARWIAGCAMGVTGVALLPPFGPRAVAIAAVVTTAALLCSIAWDWVVICGKRDDVVRWSARTGGAVTRGFPLALRMALAAAGTTAGTAPGLLGSEGGLNALAAAAALCCVLGLAARLAAMVLSGATALLLSSVHPAPEMAVVLLCAVSLVLTGAGPLRLWQPEDRWLLERRGKAPRLAGPVTRVELPDAPRRVDRAA